jgi:hypothetical protein
MKEAKAKGLALNMIFLLCPPAETWLKGTFSSTSGAFSDAVLMSTQHFIHSMWKVYEVNS